MATSSFSDAFAALRGGLTFRKSGQQLQMQRFQSSDHGDFATTSGSSDLDFFNDKPCVVERRPKKQEQETDVVVSDPPRKPTKKKKKIKSQGQADPETEEPAMKIFSGQVKKKQTISNKRMEEETNTIESASWQEEVNLLRKQHRIRIAGGDAPAPLRDFDELLSRFNCQRFLLNNLAQAGWINPTPIQRQAITILLTGQEILACAPTGSGKTLAFLIPIVTTLQAHKSEGVRALMLCPTRELALQLHRQLVLLLQGHPKLFRSCVLSKANAGSADFANIDLLFATPLRLNTLIQQEKIDLSKVQYVVMDEADKLFDMGFVSQIDTCLNACTNPALQRALFSATLPEGVEQMARSVMTQPIRVTVGERNAASSTIFQSLKFVGSEDGKLMAVRQLVRAGELCPPGILFVSSKERAQGLYDELKFDHMRVGVIHADMSATKRAQTVDEFRAGETWFLIATDVMARGMDFIGINTVLNFDFPHDAFSYIHRIGRSGRGGRPGTAITLFTEDDAGQLRTIANVMHASGCEVPAWMLSLDKARKHRKRPKPEEEVAEDEEDTAEEEPKLKRRKEAEKAGGKGGAKGGRGKVGVSTVPAFDNQKRAKKKAMVAASKQRKQKAEDASTD
ncbi:hypothetical protein CYMTET_32223 [Cymbomonas tetramitiformis]|uniref:RNA helicase n=1 Tax=Cymbomonas tetramitiformis TaxID=36881 RepID=A0AAE0FF72_9CHLO|nr:hypothetical protein CYMTET_32223 [Cymbomonas tetramitiformis]